MDNKDQTNNDQKELTLEQQLEQAQDQIAQLTDSAKRALADLENFKRRTEQEKENSRNYQTASLLLELLPIIDNLERANQNMPEEFQTHEWTKGLDLVSKQFNDLLQQKGLQEINQIDVELDPNKHEPMMQAPGKENIVLEIFEKGYILGDKVIRAAKVKVGNGE